MNPPVSTLLADKGSAIHAVPSSATVGDAVRVMNTHKLGAVLVMDGDQLAGIFTERDVLFRVVAAEKSPTSTPLSEVMTRDPKTLPADATVADALAFISEKRCRHLPIIREGRLVGLISQGDITRWLVQAHKAQADQLMSYISGELST